MLGERIRDLKFGIRHFCNALSINLRLRHVASREEAMPQGMKIGMRDPFEASG